MKNEIQLNIKLGIVAGLLNCSAWYWLATVKGFYSIEVFIYRNYITFLLLVIGVILSIFLLKRKNKGFLEFKAALKTGMIYSLVFAIILAIFNYIYFHFITPDTIDYFLNEAKNSLIQNKIKPEDIPRYLDAERSNFSSFKLVPSILFFGLLSSLLAGMILKKQNPNSLDTH